MVHLIKNINIEGEPSTKKVGQGDGKIKLKIIYGTKSEKSNQSLLRKKVSNTKKNVLSHQIWIRRFLLSSALS